MSLTRYLADLEQRLPTAARDETLEELRAHLEDCVRDLQLQGFSPTASEDEALRRFGLSQEIASAVAVAHRRPRWRALRGVGALIALSLGGTIGAGMAAAALGAGHSPTPALHQPRLHQGASGPSGYVLVVPPSSQRATILHSR